MTGLQINYTFTILWTPKPESIGVDPYIVKEDIKKQIIDPTYSLKKVMADLAFLPKTTMQ